MLRSYPGVFAAEETRVGGAISLLRTDGKGWNNTPPT
jgi:hypothetical protein